MTGDSPPRVEIILFGGPRVRVGEVEVSQFPTRYAAALLSLLALQPTRKLSRDKIAETLWPFEDTRDTLSRLRTHPWNLRKALGPTGRIVSRGNGSLSLQGIGADDVGFALFRRHLSRAATAPSAGDRIACLTAAVSLYQGPLAPEVDLPEVDDPLRSCEQDCFEALRTHSELLAESDPESAIPYAVRA